MEELDSYTVTIVRNIGIPISFTVKRRKIIFYLIVFCLVSVFLLFGFVRYLLLRTETENLSRQLAKSNHNVKVLSGQLKKLDHDRYWSSDEQKAAELSAVKAAILEQPDFSTEGIWVTNKSTLTQADLQEGASIEIANFNALVKGDDLNITVKIKNTSKPMQTVGGYICITLVNNDVSPPLYKSVTKDKLGENGYPTSYKSGKLFLSKRRLSTKRLIFRLTEIKEYYTEAMIFLFSYKGRLLNKEIVTLEKEIFLE